MIYGSPFPGNLYRLLLYRVTAVVRLLEYQPLENVGLGLAITLVAAGVNGGVGLFLLRGGQRLRSEALSADGHHLSTDVWTSVGVVAGVFLVWLTGWLVLDPLIALLVAGNIAWIGIRLLNDTAHGLLDTSLPDKEQEIITDVQSRYEESGIEFHALRTRSAGRRRFSRCTFWYPVGGTSSVATISPRG